MLFLWSNQLLKKKIRNTIRVLTICIQIRTDALSVLIWVQSVCKSYGHFNYLLEYKTESVRIKAYFSLYTPLLPLICNTFQFMLFLSSKSASSKNSFRNTIRVQTICIQIRTDALSVLIWVQSVCKSYQPTTKVEIFKPACTAIVWGYRRP